MRKWSRFRCASDRICCLGFRCASDRFLVAQVTLHPATSTSMKSICNLPHHTVDCSSPPEITQEDSTILCCCWTVWCLLRKCKKHPSERLHPVQCIDLLREDVCSRLGIYVEQSCIQYLDSKHMEVRVMVVWTSLQVAFESGNPPKIRRQSYVRQLGELLQRMAWARKPHDFAKRCWQVFGCKDEHDMKWLKCSCSPN